MRIVSLFIFISLMLVQAYAAPQHPSVIHISKALLLNADKKLIADITAQVKARDNVWATISNGDFVRVTFEQALDSQYDNSIYAKPAVILNVVKDLKKEINSIEIYPVYTDQKGRLIEFPPIAIFRNINHEGFYKVLLTKLRVPTATFDYKITGSVDIDYIVDPTYTIISSFLGGSLTDGINPQSDLILSGSTFYGMTFGGGAANVGMIFSMATTGGSFTDLHDFTASSTDGFNPSGSLVLSGSTLYGMTTLGGAANVGIILSIATTGGSFTDLHDFTASSTDGSTPVYGTPIISGSTLYGMTEFGGSAGTGIIFSMATTGGSFTDLHNFTGSTTDGSEPFSNLILSGSTLYGITTLGGSAGFGDIFSIATTGGSYTDLHNFNGGATDGQTSLGALAISGSTLYGMAETGGASFIGLIFSMATTGGSFKDLHDFSGTATDGSSPQGYLLFSGSSLYGMTNAGGTANRGIIFSIATTGGSFTDLHNFTASATDGSSPIFGTPIISGSTLYGMTQLGGGANLGIIFSIATTGSSFSDLHDFSGLTTVALSAQGDLTISGSMLYGMTRNGGLPDGGVIFSIANIGGSLTVLHSFSGSANDGFAPYGALTLSGSTLYGMTSAGGPSASAGGIIFSIATTGGSFTDIHDFSGLTSPIDGSTPYGSLTLSGSTLYGMTRQIGGSVQGIIFSIATTGGSFINLHTFSHNAGPFGSLTLSGSTLYGMTLQGGFASNGDIFSIATTGGSFTRLHNFTGSSTDGGSPSGSLTLSGSTLYGMTSLGGTAGSGIIFSIATTGGGFTRMHSFTGGTSDGSSPFGSLILSGNALFGLAQFGGASHKGIIFSIATTGGSFTDLHDFSGSPSDGQNPTYSSLIQSGCTIYGMTSAGGILTFNNGVIFSYFSSTLCSTPNGGLYYGTDF